MDKMLALIALLASFSIAGMAFAATPVGSTGLCKDGTYWSGPTKHGACKGHKGIKAWFGVTKGNSASTASSPAQAVVRAPTAPASFNGNADNGKALFARCAICHKVTKEGGNGIGPNLFGVGGRKAGTVAGFNYSDAMKSSGITWTGDKLAAYIADPKGTVKGNRMSFVGLPDATQAHDVAAYLLTLK